MTNSQTDTSTDNKGHYKAREPILDFKFISAKTGATEERINHNERFNCC